MNSKYLLTTLEIEDALIGDIHFSKNYNRVISSGKTVMIKGRWETPRQLINRAKKLFSFLPLSHSEFSKKRRSQENKVKRENRKLGF